MFSGQGSQYYQMGKDLYAHHPVFKEWMQRLDDAARKIMGQSILEKLYDAGNHPGTPFDDTWFTHPAIFMVEYALYRVFAESGFAPDYVLGASLGEFTAAAVSGACSWEDMLSILINQVKIFQKHCLKGGMCAIVHDHRLFQRTPLLHENSELASRNFPDHFVVAGRLASLKIIENDLEKAGIAHQHLPVSFGFHSALIEPAAEKLLAIMQQQRFGTPDIPFISCVRTEVIPTVQADHWWDVVRKPVEFQQTIQKIEKDQPFIYVDLGPSGTLANFVKQNLTKRSESETFHVFSPFGQDLSNLEKAMKHLSREISRPSMPPTEPTRRMQRKDKTMLTWVFPGQGSQRKGMGGNLFDAYGQWTAQADEILGYSIKTLCLEDPQGHLNLTQYTQPALYVVNALSWRKKIDESGQQPDFVAGHSLGEYSALLAAGGVDFATGLTLVKKRGALMSRATGGAMAALQNTTEDRIRAVLQQNGLDEIDIANYNAPSQIVISGTSAHIRQAVRAFREAKITCIPLNVSGAFHSRHMREAQAEFEAYLKGFQFSELSIPLISNVHARACEQPDIRANLAAQITHSVQWTDSIRYLMGQGDMRFEEVGPGNVLTHLIEKITQQADPLVIVAPVAAEDRKPVAEADERPIDAGDVPAVHAQPSPPVMAETPVPVVGEAGELATTDEVRPIPAAPTGKRVAVSAKSLGSEAFKTEYGVKYAYVAGAMARGIATEALVVRLANAGLMGYFGTAGLSLDQVEAGIRQIRQGVHNGGAFGMNLRHQINEPRQVDFLVDLCLKYGVKNVEASGFLQISPALVRYRLTGLGRDDAGRLTVSHRIMAKLSRPEEAEVFLSPAPESLVDELVKEKIITVAQAELAKDVAMADDICVTADSGGPTDQGMMTVLLPTMLRLRDEMANRFGYDKKIRVGAAGGIGTPEAAAAAFLLGADFILTGSINQCTIEAGTSESVKNLLQQINVQDTDYSPESDMFEFGTKVQVVKKGVFFPARANKLYQLYREYDAWEEIGPHTRQQIESRFFKCSFNDAYRQASDLFSNNQPEEVHRSARNSKQKMALVFRWYLDQAMQWALQGADARKVDYQVYCGPALGAFNQWVKGTGLAAWQHRHVDEIAEKLMQGTAAFLNERFQYFKF